MLSLSLAHETGAATGNIQPSLSITSFPSEATPSYTKVTYRLKNIYIFFNVLIAIGY